MGRKGYDEFSAYWPTSTDEPIASWFNNLQKYVISSSLTHPTWNKTTVVPGDVGAMQKLKDGVDGDIFLTGSATTVRWLLANGLLDELQPQLHPVIVGAGQRLFEKDTPPHKLELADSSALSTGVLHLTYRPAA